jgi:hypothetical protein
VLLKRLRGVSEAEVRRMRQELLRVRPWFLYSFGAPEPHGRDALGMILKELETRKQYGRTCSML